MLDRSRDFGEVWGPGAHRYEQDGRRFDALGMELTTDEPAAAGDSAKEAPKQRPKR